MLCACVCVGVLLARKTSTSVSVSISALATESSAYGLKVITAHAFLNYPRLCSCNDMATNVHDIIERRQYWVSQYIRIYDGVALYRLYDSSLVKVVFSVC